MIMRGFKSVLWVGAVGGAALSCYMVSLRVATERADLTRVQRQIVDARRDIRSLETELDTRGRLSQLEDWNNNVLALSAPSSSQFVKDGYTLAQLATHQATIGDRASNVRMASLDTGQATVPAKPDSAAPEKAAEAAKPVKPAPEAAPLPRVVEAVAPAPSQPAPIHRASFDTLDAPVAPAHATPAKKHVDGSAEAAPKPAKKAKVVAMADAAPTHAKTVKSAAKSDAATAQAGHNAHGATHSARADTKAAAKPSKAHSPVKLARADAPSHLKSSGHRTEAQ